MSLKEDVPWVRGGCLTEIEVRQRDSISGCLLKKKDREAVGERWTL